jgi:hypothetical protein
MKRLIFILIVFVLFVSFLFFKQNKKETPPTNALAKNTIEQENIMTQN